MSDEQKNIVFEYVSDGRQRCYCSSDIVGRFIQSLIEWKALGIGAHLDAFEVTRLFFLIAGTGLGKTVILPLHLWRLLMEHPYFASIASSNGVVSERDAPRVWVVEPKIAIAQGLASTLNDLWKDFAGEKSTSAIFGCKTSVDHKNVRAPIVFITTGIFAIYARKGVFRQGHDVLLIDEAHATLEADESVEIGIALCRSQEHLMSFMSATVDTVGLPDKLGVSVIDVPGIRFPVWKHNTGQPLDDCIVDLVKKSIVEMDVSSDVFPRQDTELGRAVVEAVTQEGRAKGMLIIVNSFSSERSDAQRVKRLLEQSTFAHPIEIGLLASEVLKNPNRRKAYERMLERWEREQKRYVLIATSVVEMGVTLPSVDFVVTMDSGFGERDGGGPLSLESLGTNALIQRMGRVGRLRPGIAYITRDIGAPYSNLSDAELNAPGALQPEPIRFPLETGHVLPLAYLSYEHPDLDIAQLPLPSGITNQPERMEVYEEYRAHLERIGVAEQGALTPLGVRMERWIGRMDLDCAIDADQCVARNDSKGLIVALCRGVLRVIPPDTLWDASGTQSLNGSDEEKLSFALWILISRFPKGETWAEHFKFADKIYLMFFHYGIREDHFFRAVMLYLEFCGVLFDILGGEKALDARSFRSFLKMQKGLETILRLLSE